MLALDAPVSAPSTLVMGPSQLLLPPGLELFTIGVLGGVFTLRRQTVMGHPPQPLPHRCGWPPFRWGKWSYLLGWCRKEAGAQGGIQFTSPALVP